MELLGIMFRWNKDIFAWTHSDMPRIHPSMTSYKLNVTLFSRLAWKKVPCFRLDRQQIIQMEIDKLAVGFIREVKYPNRLVNVVVIPKKDRKWRVCVDYTNLNEVCPNDSFHLPWINQIVDSTVEHRMLSFLDAFFGYHQSLCSSRVRRRQSLLHHKGCTITKSCC